MSTKDSGREQDKRSGIDALVEELSEGDKRRAEILRRFIELLEYERKVER